MRWMPRPINLVFILFFSLFSTINDLAAQSNHNEPLTFADTLTLDNGKIKIQITPSVGRVVWLSLSGQENLIWLDTPALYDNPRISPTTGQKYYNLGGDKLWVSPQDMWGHATGNKRWPPDGILDGSAWTLLESDTRHITIRSKPSPHYGVQVTRRFTVLENSTRVQIDNTITRIEQHPIPVMIWTVTQVKQPRLVVLDQAPHRPAFCTDYRRMKVPAPDLLMQAVTETGGVNGSVILNTRALTGQEFKIGTMGCWIAAVYDKVIFRQSSTFDPTGAYPEASSVQGYTSDVSPFAEIEILGPQSHPQPGQSISNTVIWELCPIASSDQAISLLGQQDQDSH